SSGRGAARMPVESVPKADMHVHLEATMTPALMARIAARNGVAVPDGLVTEDGARFRWDGSGTAQESLSSFVAAYDVMAGVIRAARDYEEIVHDYLVRAAAEGCIYAEITI